MARCVVITPPSNLHKHGNPVNSQSQLGSPSRYMHHILVLSLCQLMQHLIDGEFTMFHLSDKLTRPHITLVPLRFKLFTVSRGEIPLDLKGWLFPICMLKPESGYLQPLHVLEHHRSATHITIFTMSQILIREDPLTPV